jgi:hypothetical protein
MSFLQWRENFGLRRQRHLGRRLIGWVTVLYTADFLTALGRRGKAPCRLAAARPEETGFSREKAAGMDQREAA